MMLSRSHQSKVEVKLIEPEWFYPIRLYTLILASSISLIRNPALTELRILWGLRGNITESYYASLRFLPVASYLQNGNNNEIYSWVLGRMKQSTVDNNSNNLRPQL